jgi:hypothetical protein
MKTIFVPNLNYIEALTFCSELSTSELDNDCVFDFKQVKTCDPFPMLMVSSVLRRARKQHADYNWKVRNCDNTYAQHMAFFSSSGISIGKAPGEARGNSNYLPINKLSIKDLQEANEGRMAYIEELIEEKAKEMAVVLSRSDKELQNILTYLLREMIRNIPEHSDSDEVWYCAQYWPSYNLVELGLLDEGKGITASLSSNPIYREYIHNDEDALRLSLKPGVSRTFSPLVKQRHTDDDYWKNSGYGLYMASQICANLGGSFLIASGDSSLLIIND